jgi:hypothetical protein
MPITNASFNGSELRFQVIRQRDGRDIITTYTGKWNDKEIRGTVESNWAGEKQKFEWLAQRAHLGAEGTWRWTNYFGGRSRSDPTAEGGRRGRRGFVTRVELEQNGETLTGFMPGWRRGQRTEISNGIITNGVIYFEVEREFGGAKFTTKYTGKQTGDAIKGTIETIMADGEERKADWDAKRVD